MIVSKSQYREQRREVKIDICDLENEAIQTALGATSRWFYEANRLPELKRTKSHAAKLEGLNIVSKSGSSSCWTIVFSFRDHRFLIDTNDHAGHSEFFVSESDCPDNVLLEVLKHFHSCSPLVGSPPKKRIHRLFQWFDGAMCLLFGFNTFVFLSQQELDIAICFAILACAFGWMNWTGL